MDLFEQVLHAIEGEETESHTAVTICGEKAVCIRTFGPDRWFEKAALGRLDAINFLAVILFAVRDTFNLDAERRIVEDWATAIRAAAEIGEIVPRDQITLLPLHTLPDGWEWLVSIGDADSFVKARGMGWSCSSIVEHLVTQSTSPQIALLEQNPHLFATKHANTKPPASSGAPVIDEHKADGETPAGWVEQVRAIAIEYIHRHKASDLFPSQADVCADAEKVTRERKIYGPQGKPLSQSYIQRNAIQGEWWKKNKP